MEKIIKLEDIQKNTKKIYEICSDISILQREIEEMLVSIEKNSADFQKGRISRDLFKYNDDKMKRQSAGIIKKINSLIDTGVSLIGKIDKEVEIQRIETKKKKRSKISEIKKKIKRKTKKVKKKTVKRAPKKVAAVVPIATPQIAEAQALPAVEQKVEQAN